MKSLIALAATLAFATPAYAGCSNFTDGSLSEPAPSATICFEGECQVTTVDFICANARFATIGFANGWQFEAGEAGNAVAYGDRLLSEAEIASVTCTEADGAACGVLPIIQSN